MSNNSPFEKTNGMEHSVSNRAKRTVVAKLSDGEEIMLTAEHIPGTIPPQYALKVTAETIIDGDVYIDGITVCSNDSGTHQYFILSDSSGRPKVNVDQLNGATINLGTGTISTGTQRFTLASDDLLVTNSTAIKNAVEIMDDWDESDRAKVNLVVGKAGITAGAGAVADNTPRITHASDDPVTTSIQIMDDWDDGADAAKTVGNIAHDGVDAGNPIKVGGKAASSKPAAVGAGDRVDAYFDLFGRQHIFDEGGGGVGGGGYSLYIFTAGNSLGHGTATRTAATQVTITNQLNTWTPEAQACVKIDRYTSAGVFVETFSPSQNTISYAAGVYTIAGMTSDAGDLFVIYQLGPERAYNATTDAVKVGASIAHDSPDAGNPIKFGGKAVTARPAAVSASGDRVDAYFDEYGRLHTVDDGALVPANYFSPIDGTATFTSNVTITCSGFPFTVDDTNCYVSFIKYKPSGGTWKCIRNASGASIVASSNVLTVSGPVTPFAAGDTYIVGIRYQDKSYSAADDTVRIAEVNPLSLQVVEESLVDTTNVAAATNYYPSSTGMAMLGYKDISFTGKFIDVDGTITWSIQAMNDEDTASGDWVTVYGYDAQNDTYVNSMTFTNSAAGGVVFAWDFDNLNYRYVRFVMTNSGATNTCIVKCRRKAL